MVSLWGKLYLSILAQERTGMYGKKPTDDLTFISSERDS